jgi:hypothetical protein
MARFRSLLTPSSLLPLLFVMGLSGCDLINQRLGIEDPGKKEARLDGEGRAVGSACRQSGRAIEDCYTIYHWLPKASVFAGWRDMNDYMLANQLKEVAPTLEPPPSPDELRRQARTQAAVSAAQHAAVPEAPGAVPPAATSAEGKN